MNTAERYVERLSGKSEHQCFHTSSKRTIFHVIATTYSSKHAGCTRAWLLCTHAWLLLIMYIISSSTMFPMSEKLRAYRNKAVQYNTSLLFQSWAFGIMLNYGTMTRLAIG